ncbi:MAG: hypothetical protein M3Q69_08965 [Acidobacteriota bacterium]|nr:hypothetical protein [Acidobacteriota bacterium]
MTNTRVVDNTNRPAQPEPGEDEATQMPPVREDAPVPEQDEAKQKERERQTGE